MSPHQNFALHYPLSLHIENWQHKGGKIMFPKESEMSLNYIAL
jgi:hypothetical protein